jgi:LysM repeat protein
MARYSSDFGKQKIIYISLAVILVVVIVFIYIWLSKKAGVKPSGGNGQQVSESKTGAAAEQNPAGSNSTVDKLIAEATACVNATPPKIIEARDKFNEILPMLMNSKQKVLVKEQLTKLSEQWLFSKKIYPEDILCGSYKVLPGDKLATIGKQFEVPYEIIMQINKIPNAASLQADSTIKIVKGPFHVRVYRSTFTMDLYLKDTYVQSFTVGLGKPGFETPTGKWRVAEGGKLISPRWTDPDTGKTYRAEDPDYPLGSRWIALEGIDGNAKGRTGFAIHGTKDPNEIGTAGSRGCIRLHNGNAVLVYNLLVPGSSLVEVVN